MKTHVVKTTPDASLREAIDLMDLYQVSSLPVVDRQGRLCGMLSESDVIRRFALTAFCAAQDFPPSVSSVVSEGLSVAVQLNTLAVAEQLVNQCMTTPAVSISEQVTVRVAAERMLCHRFKRLPVLDAEERVVGVLNRVDLIQALFESAL